MSVFDLFEEMRRANADLYTANPLEQMSEEKLEKLADQVGMTVDELREHSTTPHVEATCPLCGRPSTHLVNCKGCGGDAWGGEWVMIHGDDVHGRLREAFKVALTNPAILAKLAARWQTDLATEGWGEKMPAFTPEQVKYATKHAYHWGGCSVCVECWHNTLPVDAYRTCPLNLLAESTLNDDGIPAVLYPAFLDSDGDAEAKQAILSVIEASFTHWTAIWNTVADPVGRTAVGTWRYLLLKGAWDKAVERQHDDAGKQDKKGTN